MEFARVRLFRCCLALLWSIGFNQISLFADEKAVATEPSAAATSTEPVKATDHRIAIVPFDAAGASIEGRALGAAISDLLAADLSKASTVRFVSRDDVDKSIVTETPNPADTADLMLTGTVQTEGTKLSLTARLAVVGGGEQIGEWTLEGSIDDLFRLCGELARTILVDRAVDFAKQRPRTEGETGSSQTLAILPLVNRFPRKQPADFGARLAEVIQGDLSASSRISLVDRDRVNVLMPELDRSAAADADLETLIPLGRQLGAQRLLVGAFWQLQSEVCIHIRLIDASNGSVVACHNFIQPRDRFDALRSELVSRVLSDMGTQPVTSTEDTLAPQAVARTLEGTICLAAIVRLARQGKSSEAIDVCQQALAIEPGNLCFHRELIPLLRAVNKAEDALQAVSAAAARPEFAMASESDRKAIMGGELISLFRLQRFAEMIPAAETYKRSFPDPRSGDFANAWICTALNSLKRGDEIASFLEKNAAEETDRAHDWDNSALKRLYAYYRDDAPLRLRTQLFTRRMPFDIEASKALAKKVMAIYERVLTSATGHQDDAASDWAKLLIPDIATTSYLDSAGVSVPFLTVDQQIDALRRGLQTFGWNPAAASIGRFRLAQLFESTKKWDDAVSTYRQLARSSQGAVLSNLPSTWDLSTDEPTSWIDRKIEAYYRAAKLLDESLERKDDAREAYRELVREVGLAHFAGPDALVAMNRLKLTPEFPSKCALIWGGETSGVLSWQKRLEPLGFSVHTLRDLRVNPPQLTPYSLVVLNRAGDLPYTPRELLALRSYVAAGGSLLVIVSPGWAPSASGIHNPLLAFFGMECQAESVIEAISTRLAAHPIATGLTQVMARNAVHIRANDAATVVQAHDQVVLAATPYRFGRVVVASFGQWYLPDTSILPSDWKSLVTAGRKANVHLTPVEFGDRLEVPLLSNVIRWLTQTQNRDAKFVAWRRSWAEAQLTAWRAQAHVEPASMRIVPWEEMRPALERVIKNAPDSMAKEESLWMAAEAFQQMGFYHFGESGAEPRPPLSYPAYGYNPLKKTPLLPEAKYYQLLIQQFPQSPLRPYAEWRSAECLRRTRFVSGAPQVISTVSDVETLVSEYEKIDAPARSYALAWKNLRLGAIGISTEDYQGAIPRFQHLVDSMSNGPEKTMAVLNLALCYEKLNNPTESRRFYESVLQMPDIHWRPTADWFMLWVPLTTYAGYVPPAFGARGNAWQLARDGIARLSDTK
ncbi:tetratricopeptide repeat protein [Schlesneria paludicola]|uniref:tetratricopeptide repeat protein n=1 Tax=Schlesneria paludicola TaxID=360056 RepID=UPI00029AA6A5|nr:tetratricopeptide repeat protein [Schlesneria paludicola]